MKPAPIQMTWLGYFGTTGLPEMDYIIADRFVVPENHDQYYTEQVWRMPYSYLCYSKPNHDIPLAEAPALANGFVTLGCFNHRSDICSTIC